mgnify:CR=1 FL=1
MSDTPLYREASHVSICAFLCLFDWVVITSKTHAVNSLFSYPQGLHACTHTCCALAAAYLMQCLSVAALDFVSLLRFKGCLFCVEMCVSSRTCVRERA